MNEKHYSDLCRKAANHFGVDWNSFDAVIMSPVCILIRLDGQKRTYRVTEFEVLPNDMPMEE